MTSKMTKTKTKKTISVDIKLKPVVKEKDEEDSYSCEMTPGKKGGDYTLPLNGKILFLGNSLGRRDLVRFEVVSPWQRHNHMPVLKESEKLCSEIFVFKISPGARLKSNVTLELPYYEADFNYYDLFVKTKDSLGQWVDVDDFQLDNATQRAHFEASYLDTFAVIGRLKIETFDISPAGCIYNAKIAKYTSARFPKKATESAIMCGIQIYPVNHDRLHITKSENQQIFHDFIAISDFFEFKHNGTKLDFKRAVTLKLPVPDYFGDKEQNADEIAVLEKTNKGTWQIIESPIKITRQTLSFDVRQFSRYCIGKCKAQRQKRLEEVLPLIDENNNKIKSELLTFIKFEEKRWRFLTTVTTKPTENKVRKKWKEWGWKEVEKIIEENNNNEEKMFPRSRRAPRYMQQEIKPLSKDLELLEGQTVYFKYTGEVKEVEVKEIRQNLEEDKKDDSERYAENMEKETDEIKDRLGAIGIKKEEKEEEKFEELYLVTSHENSYRHFEIEPLATDEKDMTVKINFHTNDLATQAKRVAKTVVIDITAKMVHDYFYVEPEPEPEAEPEPEPTPEPEIIEPVQSPRSMKFRSFEGNESFMRLTTPKKNVPKIPRESKVMTGRSLMNLAREIEQGLTLAVYLDIPDSSITGIGFDALSNGLNLVDVTYKILLLWKRKIKREEQVDSLAESLRQMGRSDVADILIERHKLNLEITPECFSC